MKTKLIPAAILSLGLAACGTTGIVPGESTGGPDDIGVDALLSPPTAVPGATVTLTVRPANFQLVDPEAHAAKAPGQGHYVVFLDGMPVYEGADESTRIQVPADPDAEGHLIEVVLVDNDGIPLQPKVSNRVSLAIKDLGDFYP